MGDTMSENVTVLGNVLADILYSLGFIEDKAIRGSELIEKGNKLANELKKDEIVQAILDPSRVRHFKEHIFKAVSIDDCEDFVNKGDTVYGMLIWMDKTPYIFFEVGESGDFWLECIKVQKSSLERMVVPRKVKREARHCSSSCSGDYLLERIEAR